MLESLEPLLALPDPRISSYTFPLSQLSLCDSQRGLPETDVSPSLPAKGSARAPPGFLDEAQALWQKHQEGPSSSGCTIL